MTELRRLRVDHVGSLLRPEYLKQAFLDRGNDKFGDQALRETQNRAISELVAQEEKYGLPVITDGEFRRLNWQVSFSTVNGWDLWEGSWRAFLNNPSLMYEGEKPGQRGADAVETFKVPATDKLQLLENFPLQEYRYLASQTELPAKAILMGPDRVTQMCDIDNSDPHYSGSDEFLNDVAAIQGEMVGQLIAAGCPYIQLDEPSYTGYVDRATLERIAARGEDPVKNLKHAISASNSVIEDHRGKACFGIHICRGNRASMWHREGTYDGIAEVLFGSLSFDRLLLEYDTERAGGFEPLRFVPKGGPTVVLGLITTKTEELETRDALLKRIEDAQQYIDIDQLAISPQCGFASGIAGNMISEVSQWKKLELMLEVAAEVWG